ncbi:MAG: hypothetical protein V1875_06140 [Candidatus Altiarchaeota archaeon]
MTSTVSSSQGDSDRPKRIEPMPDPMAARTAEGMGAIFEGHPFRNDLMCVLEGRTQVGAQINTLALDLLKFPEIREATPFSGEAHLSPRVFDRVWDFTEGRDFSWFDPKREDMLFILSTGAGDAMRRALIVSAFHQSIEKEIKTTNPLQESQKKALIDMFKAYVWGPYLRNRETKAHIMYSSNPGLVDLASKIHTLNILMDGVEPARFGSQTSYDIMRQGRHDPAGAFDAVLVVDIANRDDDAKSLFVGLLESIRNKVCGRFEHFKELLPGVATAKSPFFTDIGHSFKIATTIWGIQAHMNMGLKPLELNRECSLLVAENDPLDAALFAMIWHNKVKNLSMYEIYDESPDSPYEENGIVATKRRFLEVVAGYTTGSGKLPDLVMLDVELDDGADAGLELARELKAKYGRGIRICMMYSSNPEKVREIQKLHEDGIVDLFWHKRDFTLEKMVVELNKLLPKE